MLRAYAVGVKPQLGLTPLLISRNTSSSSSVVRFCSGPESADKMEKKKDQAPLKKSEVDIDDMSESFGEAYATRSEEEGFGGIYGGKESSNVIHQKITLREEDDGTQGNEVKEKERARNQKEPTGKTN